MRTGLLSFLFLLLLFAPAFAAANSSNTEYAGVWLNEARTLQIGGRDAVWIRMGRSGDDTQAHALVVDLYNSTPAKEMVLLRGPWAGGAGRLDEFGRSLQAGLRQAGWKLHDVNFSSLAGGTLDGYWDLTGGPDSRANSGRLADAPGSLANSGRAGGRIFILPSGVWPYALMDNWSRIVGPADALVYLGVRADQTLDEAGAVHAGGVRSDLMAAGAPADSSLGGERLLSAEGTAVWRIPHTLNEYDDLQPLGEGLAHYAIAEMGRGRISSTTLEWGALDAAAVVLRPAGSHAQEAWARLILMGEGGKWQRVWDLRVPPSSGVVDGPAQVNMGEAAAFQIQLKPDYPQTERIRYFAQLYAPNQSLYWQQELGEGQLAPGGAWVGSFTYRGWPQGGDWRVDVQDQFGRSYAGALLHVVEYSLEAMEPLGGAQRLRILRDGRVMQDGGVRLRLHGSEEWTDARISQGVLSFSTARNGAQAVEVEVDGTRLAYSWRGAEEGPWAGALRWGLPAMAAALLLYFFLRPKGRAKYRIRLLEQPAPSGAPVRLPASRWLKILGEGAGECARKGQAAGGKEWVVRADEAAERMQSQRVDGRALVVSQEGAQALLEELAKRGELAKWREWYGPVLEKRERTRKGSSWPAESEDIIRQRALMRQLRDRLVEAGLAPKCWKGRAGQEGYADPQGRRWQVHQPLDYGRERERLENAARGCLTGPDADAARVLPHALVFADEGEREEFLRWLGGASGAAAERLRLALRTGRIRFINVAQPIRA